MILKLMVSIFDKLIAKGSLSENKSLSRMPVQHITIWRVEHENEEVGPYNKKPRTEKQLKLRQRLMNAHQTTVEEIKHPGWGIDGIEWKIAELEGLAKRCEVREKMRNYQSAFESPLDALEWFDGYIDDLSECGFILAQISVPEDCVIYGSSCTQVAFPIKYKNTVKKHKFDSDTIRELNWYLSDNYK